MSPFRELDLAVGILQSRLLELASTHQPAALVGLEAAAGCKGRFAALVPERYAVDSHFLESLQSSGGHAGATCAASADLCDA